ncbi:hypothetical protein [Streptomyces sp. NPDC053431]|uniref:hypothetical protein n=1 Tax=Streptomyces sp. NPDC053431 TaxID=3365703 RepID=UPI0037CE7D54
MRRAFATALMTAAVTVAGMSTAVAQSPHFIGEVTCTKSLTAGLSCSGKAAGLGNSPTGAFLTADSVDAEYVCVNRGGNVAPGQGTETQNVVGPTRTIQPRNGQITFTGVSLPPPDTPSAREVCPNGNWRVHLLHLTYTNVVLHIQQNGEDILTRELGTLDP